MIKYNTVARESGDVIDTFDTLKEAELAIADYEGEDKVNGDYEEGFYSVTKFNYCPPKADVMTVYRIVKIGLGMANEELRTVKLSSLAEALDKEGFNWMVNPHYQDRWHEALDMIRAEGYVTFN